MVGGSDLDLGSEKCPSDYPWLLISSHIRGKYYEGDQERLGVVTYIHIYS